MKKYIIPASLLLLCNEVISLAALAIIAFMFIFDIMEARA